jgi:hypothetical protein
VVPEPEITSVPGFGCPRWEPGRAATRRALEPPVGSHDRPGRPGTAEQAGAFATATESCLRATDPTTLPPREPQGPIGHDAWLQPTPLSAQVAAAVDDVLRALEVRFPAVPQGDAAAETLEADPDEVEAFREQIQHKSYQVRSQSTFGDGERS